ncbi:MAG: hypothetical protein GXO74_10645 [Calditrichaeota bacterium]|nr:hypothetical protein [Calditrichota bacterium]
MPVDNFRFQRHLKLWEDQNKQIKRTIFFSLIVGILLLIDVLTPLTKLTGRTDEVEAELQQMRSNQEMLQQTTTQLQKLNEKFNQVQEVIARKPWEIEKNKLIRRFRLMRENPDLEANYPAYSDTANQTIRRIAKIVKNEILQPLKSALSEAPKNQFETEELQVQLSTIEKTVQQWEENHLRDNWYITLEGKGETVQELDRYLNQQMQHFRQTLVEKQVALKTKQQETSQQMKEMATGISEKEKWLADLNQKMQEILPGWARGLFDVEDVVQLFPPALIVLTIYIIGLGVSLTRHFLFIAKEMGLKKSDRADPAVSSWWTMVNKGKLGTFLTVGTYVGIILILWLFSEWGYVLFQRWLATTDIRSFLTMALDNLIFPWFSRLIYVLLIFVILKRPKLFFQLS